MFWSSNALNHKHLPSSPRAYLDEKSLPSQACSGSNLGSPSPLFCVKWAAFVDPEQKHVVQRQQQKHVVQRQHSADKLTQQNSII